MIFEPSVAAKTATARRGASKPLRFLLERGLIKPNEKILDYGCGKGSDVETLRSLGFDVEGWDPYQPGWDDPSVLKDEYYDVVLNFYVLNVLPIEHRYDVLVGIWRVLRKGGRAYIAVRDVSESKIPKGTPYEDGIITSRGTFQTWFTPEKLEETIRHVQLFKEVRILNRRQPLIAEAVKGYEHGGNITTIMKLVGYEQTF